MTKQEFDDTSVARGFGPCADYMWPEIERCYSASDRIGKELMADIYWHEPRIFCEILALRNAIMEVVKHLELLAGYGCDSRENFSKVAKLYDRLDEAITDAVNRMADRAKGQTGESCDGEKTSKSTGGVSH